MDLFRVHQHVCVAHHRDRVLVRFHRALVRLYVSAQSAGCSLELMHLSKQIQHLLGLTHMLSVFTVIGENGIKFM